MGGQAMELGWAAKSGKMGQVSRGTAEKIYLGATHQVGRNEMGLSVHQEAIE